MHSVAMLALYSRLLSTLTLDSIQRTHTPHVSIIRLDPINNDYWVRASLQGAIGGWSGLCRWRLHGCPGAVDDFPPIISGSHIIGCAKGRSM